MATDLTLKFYVAPHSGSILFSCKDLVYLQLIQPHPVLIKCMPCETKIISSKHDLAYINIVTRNKQASHYQSKQSSVPLQTTTHIPATNEQVSHTLEEVKKKYSDVFDGLGKFPGEPYHINLDPEVPPKQSHADLCLFTTKRNLRNSWLRCSKLGS